MSVSRRILPTGSPPPRTLARALAVVVLGVLGVLAAARLEVSYLPERTFPELRVHLQLHEPRDVAELSRRWLQPLEAAVRAAGGVTSTAGEVGPGGASLRVRLAPGTRVRRKAARLESELAGLARRLGDEGTVRVDASGGGVQGSTEGVGTSAVVFLPEDEEREGSSNAVRALVEALRNAPETGRVNVAGRRERELRWASRSEDLEALRASLRGAFGETDRRLGRFASGGRDLPVQVAEPDAPAHERWVARDGRALRVGSLATPTRAIRDSEFLARAGGRPGLVLLVGRDPLASPLALERAVERELARFGYAARAVFLWSEADPIEDMLRRLALGALLALAAGAGLVAVVFGFRAALWQAAAVPLALAAVANVFYLLELPVDVTTAQAAVLALAGSLVFQAIRRSSPDGGSALSAWVFTALCAGTLPVAVHLLGRDLATYLSEPVRAFAAALPAAALALCLLPTPGSRPRPRADQAARRTMRFVLRRPWAVTLLAVAIGYGAFGVFGDRLQPRPGRLLPASADVAVDAVFGEGGTLEQAARWTEAVERHLLGRQEVATVWGYHDRERATLLVTVREEHRTPLALRRLSVRWTSQLTALGSSVEVRAFGGLGRREPLRFDSSLRTRPEVDDEVSFYRAVLRSTDLARLLRARTQLEDDLRATWWGHEEPRRIRADWTEPSPRLELVPREGVHPDRVAAARRLLAERVTPPGGGRDVDADVPVRGAADRPVVQTVVPRSAAATTGALRGAVVPGDALRESPQLADVLAPGSTGTGEVLAPAELFLLRESVGSPTLRREDGAFVLPVTVRFFGLARGEKMQARDDAHRLVARFGSPGVDVEAPSLEPDRWTEQRLRLLSIATGLPLLFLVLASVRLDSVPLALSTLLPPAVAVGTTAAALAALDLRLDEITLLALAASLAATLPLVLEVAHAVRVRRRGRLAASAGYRWLVRRLPHAAVALGCWLTLLVGSGWGLDAERFPWAPPLRVAGISGAAVVASALLVLPGLLRAVDRLRFYDREEASRLAAPPAWRTDAAPELEVRRLTKIYGNGFRALHGVSFRLEPGIVGLLGPNGAGKTTLLRSLCGLLEPTRGRVLYRGVAVGAANLAAYRRRVGFLPQDFDAYEGFSAEDFLDYWALQRGIRDPRARRREIEELLRLVGLEDAAGRKVRDFSGGMRRRIGIARSLLGAPPILIVDEPTTGLDVESRNRLRESLLAAAGERIIFFSTHIASDVAAAASRILLLHQGRLLFDGPSGELIEEAHGRVFETLVDDDALRDFAATYRVTTRLRTLEGVRVRAVAAADQEPAGEIVRPNLEEAYLAKLGTTAQKRARVKSLLDL